MRVLLVEDDAATAQSIEMMLRSESYICDTTDMGEDGLEIGKLYDYDIIVLDLMLPDIDGYEVLRRLRAARVKTPILILSGLTGLDEKIKGLGFGADDYLTKPFEPRELVLRINAILRRTQEPVEPAAGVVNFGDFTFDLVREELHKAGEYVRLTAAESALLKTLARRPGEAVTREVLSAESPVIGSGRAIDVQVTRLRRKIEEDPKYPRYLRAVRGVGYLFVPN